MFTTPTLLKAFRLFIALPITLLSLLSLTGCLEDVLDPDDPEPDPLTVVSIIPFDGETEVPSMVPITIVFSDDVASSSLSSSRFRVTNLSNSSTVATTISGNRNTVILDPVNDLEYETTYEVSISAGTESESGGILESTYVSQFTVEDTPDTEGPVIISYSPTTDMDFDENIVVTFSESLNSATVNTSTFVLLDDDGNTVSVDVSLNDYMVTVDPASSLRGGHSNYYLTISADVEDLVGNKHGSFEELNFRTTNIELTLSEMVGGTSDVEIGENLQFTFSADIDPGSIVEDQIYVFQNGSYTYGAVSVSGNTLTFAPNSTLNEFLTSYSFYYGGLEDIDGNTMSTSQSSISFTTVLLSANYWYFIYNRGVSGRVTGDVFSVPYELFYLTDGVTYCNNLWGFDDLGNDYFSIRHSNCAEGGDGRYLEGGGANGTASMQDATNLPTGMQWRFANAGSGYYWMTNLHMDGEGNNYWFKGVELGLRAYSGTSDFQWYFERTTSTR